MMDSRITFTPYGGIFLLLILILIGLEEHLVSLQSFENGDVRLVNGNTQLEGRVEVYYNGEWGTICDDLWTIRIGNGNVVCSQLGLGQASEVYGDAYFGEGTGTILLDDIVCLYGDEANIGLCSHNGWGVNNCQHGEDAGVRCDNGTKDTELEDGDVRLAGSRRPHEGRVEVYYNEEWGTICDDSWDANDALVVCRQLGYESVAGVLDAAWFGEGIGTILLDELGCLGVESNIAQCDHRGWGVNDCTHSEDAGVRCQQAVKADQSDMIRLVSGNTPFEGRVEVYYNGEWGTVCDDSWGTTDGEVVCRQLGFGPVSETYVFFGEGTELNIVLDEVTCFGLEARLLDCGHNGWGTHDCGHNEDVGVRCNPSGFDTGCLAGWDIMNRGGPDSPGWTMVSPSKVITCDGFVSEWRYQAKRSHPFRAVVWRQVAGTSTEFQIVGINDIPAGATNTEVIYQVPANERIAVKAGDMIGWSFGEGVLTYNSGGDALVRWVGGNLHASLVENQIRDINGGSETRSYAIKATVGETKVQDRKLVFKAISGRPGHGDNLADPDPYEIYTQSGGHNEDIPNIMDLSVSYPGHYKSSEIDRWDQINVLRVDLVLYDQVGIELLQMNFNGRGSTKFDWMSEYRLINNSRYNDIRDPSNYFDVGGHGEVNRRFYINKEYNGCEGDSGWLVMIPRASELWEPTPCDWETALGYTPAFMYSTSPTAVNWNSADVGQADILAIFLTLGVGQALDSVYLGCYIDASDRALNEYLLDDHNIMTPEYCISICKGRGARYAGLEYMYQCFCGGVYDDYAKHGRASEDECNSLCSGDQSLICGGGWRLSVYQLFTVNGDVRLVNGKTHEGRVEVYYDDEWGTVCGYGWDFAAANVVCHQLGYNKAVEIYSSASQFGSGTGSLLLDVQCNGNEDNLVSCSNNGWSTTLCDHQYDAGVKCEPHKSDEGLSPWAIAGIVIACLVGVTIVHSWCKQKRTPQQNAARNQPAPTPAQTTTPNNTASSNNAAADLPPTYDICLEETPNSLHGFPSLTTTPSAPHWENNDVPTTPPPSYDIVVAQSSEFNIPQGEPLPPLYSSSLPPST